MLKLSTAYQIKGSAALTNKFYKKKIFLFLKSWENSGNVKGSLVHLVLFMKASYELFCEVEVWSPL